MSDSSNRNSNKVAIVTAASRGIGAGCAAEISSPHLHRCRCPLTLESGLQNDVSALRRDFEAFRNENRAEFRAVKEDVQTLRAEM